MKPENSDLQALAAAAHGQPMQARPQMQEDPIRAARVAELKAKYEAGTLTLDENALAEKIIDAMLGQP